MGTTRGILDIGKPETLAERIRRAELKTKSADFETELSGNLAQLLATYNDRDTGLVKERLEDILQRIENEIEGSLRVLFGGSIAKHTYIDGLSDIDALLLIDKSELIDQVPPKVLEYVKHILTDRLPSETKVETGNLAVTVEYSDGMKIQVLPAIQTDKGYKISSPGGKDWSKINPKGFATALSKWNERLGYKLVPAIKFIKVINAQFPQKFKLTGYHIESLALNTFKAYSGPKTMSNMLPHFFEQGKDLVLSSIIDKTGQSVHVDYYLGENNSSERKQISHLFNRVLKRMINASAAGSVEQWLTLFGE